MDYVPDCTPVDLLGAVSGGGIFGRYRDATNTESPPWLDPRQVGDARDSTANHLSAIPVQR